MSQVNFVRELLLGIDEVKPASRAEIGRYFARIIGARGCPLHVTSLWNALYYDWDPETGAYDPEAINRQRVLRIELGADCEPIPVGAFVSVPSGQREVWAEAVYKEGRNPEVALDGTVPARVSGAPAVLTGDPPRALVHEYLALDWNAFGPDHNERTVIDRLRRREVLNAFEHLEVDVCYESDEAELDDAAYYAAWLMRHHREGLLGEFVEPDTSDDVLHALLLTSLNTVAEIASRSTDLIRVTGYFALADDYRAVVEDRSLSAILGVDFFHSTFTALTRLPAKARVGYAAVGPRLVDYFVSGGLDDAEDALLAGPGYGRLVNYMNLYAMDQVRGLPEGTLRRYEDELYHLRRDDPWQSGGVWRSERLDSGPSEYGNISPLIPLGLGADSERAEAPTLVDPKLGSAPVEILSGKEFRVTLSLRDIEDETMPVGAGERFLRFGSGVIRLKVIVQGSRDPLVNERVSYDPRAKRLLGVPWGTEVFAGVRLYCGMEGNGVVLRASARPLVPPQAVGGQMLTLEYDPAYFAEQARRLPLAKKELKGASSLRELISRAFANRGEELDDGARRLSPKELVIVVGGLEVGENLASVILHTADSMDVVSREADGRLVWHPRVTRRTRSTDATVLRTFTRTRAGAHVLRRIRPHVVRMHLRRLEHKDPATWAHRAAIYRAALEKYGAKGRITDDLPRGKTFVRAFTVGGKQSLKNEFDEGGADLSAE